MKVTYEEFFKDPKKYITIAETEDLYLIKNGIIYLHLNNPCGDRLKAARKLIGVLKGCDIDDKDLGR